MNCWQRGRLKIDMANEYKKDNFIMEHNLSSSLHPPSILALNCSRRKIKTINFHLIPLRESLKGEGLRDKKLKVDGIWCNLLNLQRQPEHREKGLLFGVKPLHVGGASVQ